MANVYSLKTLPVMASLLEENICDARTALVDRIKRCVNHVERSSHFKVEEHNNNLEHIEQVTPADNDEHMDPSLRWLKNSAEILVLCGVVPGSCTRYLVEGRKYETHCQLVFSHCQHHLQALDEEGKRAPLNYCAVKRQKNNEELCKMR